MVQNDNMVPRIMHIVSYFRLANYFRAPQDLVITSRLITRLQQRFRHYSYAKLFAVATFLNQIARVMDPEDRAAIRPVRGLIAAISTKLNALAPTVTTSVMTTTRS